VYHYRATVQRVVDGDTVDLVVDVGFRVTVTDRFRLFGIDTPELRAPTYEAGHAARLWLENLIGGRELLVETHKPSTDKYGRWLATLFLDDVNVNTALVDAGHAVFRVW